MKISLHAKGQRAQAALAEHRAALLSFKLPQAQRTAVMRSLRRVQRTQKAILVALDRVQRMGGTPTQRKLAVEVRLLRRMLKMRSFDGPHFKRKLAEVEAVRKVALRSPWRDARDAEIARARADARKRAQ